MPRRLSTYIFKEIAVPFVLCIVILTATALLSKAIKLVDLMLTHGVGPSFIFWFVVSVIPGFLIYTIPISFLAGVLIAFTRLSSDSEITAIKASGLSLFTMMRPVVALALVAFAAGIFCTSYVFPWGNQNMKRLLYDAGRTGFAGAIEEKTFYDRFSGAVLYVDRYDTDRGEMEGVFISEEADDGSTTVFMAPRGVIATSADGEGAYVRLYDGTLHKKGKTGDAYHLAEFSSYTLELDLTGGQAPASDPSHRPNRELYPLDIYERARDVRASGGDPSPYLIDLHKRFALPASVFVFSLLGVPLGVQRVRTARMTGFSTALGVVLVYYLLSTALEALGEGGSIPAVLSVWGSDIIFAAAGAYVLYKAARDVPLERSVLLGPLAFFSGKKGGAGA